MVFDDSPNYGLYWAFREDFFKEREEICPTQYHKYGTQFQRFTIQWRNFIRLKNIGALQNDIDNHYLYEITDKERFVFIRFKYGF
jgi:hypothetical protein